MLTQLSTVRTRLAITDTTSDTLLTTAIEAVSARFDKETSRTLARTENGTFEFDPADTELSPPAYPIESVSEFESKSSEASGWQEITPMPDHLIRNSCIISLRQPLCFSLQPLAFRLVFTGGYVLPGTTPGPGQTPLPADLENACIEQVAYWFQNRDQIGLKTYWPSGVAYQQFATQDLLESVSAVLAKYRRYSI